MQSPAMTSRNSGGEVVEPIRFLFATGFQHLPQMYGGIMSNTHELSLELLKRGHAVAVAADLLATGYVGLRSRLLGKLTPKRTVHDSFLGYPVYRRWDVLKAIPDLVALIKPDVALVQPSLHVTLARELNRLSVPVIVYFHDVLFDRLDGDPREIENALFLANSEFTAHRYKEQFGVSATVIPPMFHAELYRARRAPQNVTFINPQPFKGSDLALELVARCPDIPFCFVESWELPEQQKQVLKRHMKMCPNLTLRARTMNMKDVYRRAKLVLVPSLLEEAWGRVASEAHFNGVPVIASNRGGLVEAVGPGGVLLDPDGPIEAWVDAVRRLWTDKPHYDELSAAALTYSTRPEIDPGVQITTLLSVASAAMGRNVGSQPAQATSDVV
jgi:glycosyltransferase involved in cell wall biosynthesis